MKFQKLLIVIFSLCCFQSSFATTGSLTSVGALGLGGAEDTGLREMVELSATGGLLVGNPKNSMVKLITVSVTKPHSDGRIIIRELIAGNGAKTLAITAPDSLVSDIRRINIFINTTGEVLSMKRYGADDQLATIEPFLLKVDKGSNNTSAGTLVGYSVDRPGVFELYVPSHEKSSQVINTVAEPTARNLIGGSYYHGFLPWIMAGLLMLFGWGISRWTHRITQKELT